MRDIHVLPDLGIQFLSELGIFPATDLKTMVYILNFLGAKDYENSLSLEQFTITLDEDIPEKFIEEFMQLKEYSSCATLPISDELGETMLVLNETMDQCIEQFKWLSVHKKGKDLDELLENYGAFNIEELNLILKTRPNAKTSVLKLITEGTVSALEVMKAQLMEALFRNVLKEKFLNKLKEVKGEQQLFIDFKETEPLRGIAIVKSFVNNVHLMFYQKSNRS